MFPTNMTGGDRGDRGLVFPYLRLTLTPELIPLAESHYALQGYA